MQAPLYLYSNSFKYKKSLQIIFSDILNLHFIDYVSIAELTPSTVTIYSSEPALEANLVENDLMRHDKIYTALHRDNTLLLWENYYNDQSNEVKELKTINHKFQFGFSLFQPDNILYSFATKSHIKNAERFYSDRIGDLYAMGKYCYKQLKVKKLLESPSSLKKSATILPFTLKEKETTCLK